MRMMTCKQMGGVCDTPIYGNTAEEMMDNGAKHIMSMNDEAHKKIAAEMMNMKKDPMAAKKWNEAFTKKFNALPTE